MKKLFYVVLALSLSIVSCSKFDDTEIWNKLNDHETRIAYLEEICEKMNADIINLQALVTALEGNDYIVSASPLVTGDGYTFVFKSGKSVVIYNGKDGVNGTNGIDGVDGKNGETPIISVMKDVDGIYYWTVNGEWLIVNGEKVRASAMDGKNGDDGNNGVNGENGKDGITPKFKIENDYWYVSYTNGASWEKLGKATGNNGLNGDDGDSFFKGVSMADGFVQFTLNDDNGTVIKVPYLMEDTLVFVSDKPGDVKQKLTNQQKRSVVHLIVEGYIDGADVRYLADQMLALEILDLRKTNLTEVPAYAFCKGEVKYGKDTIRRIYLPITCISVGEWAFYGCTNLEYIEAKGNVLFASNSLIYCDNISLTIGASILKGENEYPYPNMQIDTLCLCGTIVDNISGVNVKHLKVCNSVQTVRKHTLGYFDDLYVDSIMFEEPSLLTSIDMGLLESTRLHKIELPTSIKQISSQDTYVFTCNSVETVIIPTGAQLQYWELYEYYIRGIKEIYCYLETPPTLAWNGSNRINPTVYVPLEYYAIYISAPIWKEFTIKAIM